MNGSNPETFKDAVVDTTSPINAKKARLTVAERRELFLVLEEKRAAAEAASPRREEIAGHVGEVLRLARENSIALRKNRQRREARKAKSEE